MWQYHQVGAPRHLCFDVAPSASTKRPVSISDFNALPCIVFHVVNHSFFPWRHSEQLWLWCYGDYGKCYSTILICLLLSFCIFAIILIESDVQSAVQYSLECSLTFEMNWFMLLSIKDCKLEDLLKAKYFTAFFMSQTTIYEIVYKYTSDFMTVDRELKTNTYWQNIPIRKQNTESQL